MSEFSTSCSNEDLLTGYTDSYGVVYSADKKRLLKGCSVDEYKVRDGTEVICDCAFQCKNLKSIILPDTLLAIGACAFANNEHMSCIEIPKNVVYLAKNNPFVGCISLNSVKIESQKFIVDGGLIYDRDYQVLYSALHVFTSGAVVCINAGVREISKNCFRGHKNISKVMLPESLEAIPDSFMTLSSCKYLFVPDSVKYIGQKAFFMSNFGELKIGKSIEKIGKYAFSTLSGLKKVRLDNVSSIGEYAFSSCHDLEYVELNGCITAIEKSSFSSCKSLEWIKLPQSVTTIRDNAITFLPSLKRVELAGKLRIVDYGNFRSCGRLEEILVSPQYYFDCYMSIAKHFSFIASRIYDNRHFSKNDSVLGVRCEQLCLAYKSYINAGQMRSFDSFKSHLIAYSKELEINGWFTKTEYRNYLMSGTASMIYARYIKDKCKKTNGVILSLNDLGLTYYVLYQDSKIRYEAAILIVRLLMEYRYLLDDIIASCLSDLDIVVDNNNKNVYIAYITEFLFCRAVNIDKKNRMITTNFENRKDLLMNQILEIRHDFLNEILPYFPNFYQTENVENVFERNYTLLMRRVRIKSEELSRCDYDDINIQCEFVRKIKLNEMIII